jgi:uncharacterized protein
MPWLDRVVKLLLPREDHFFDLLEKGAACAARSGALLARLCEQQQPSGREPILAELREVEHLADSVIHEVYDALNRTFVTPIDRSDIYTLATQLEEIVDLNHATAMQTVFHAMTDLPEGSAEIGALIEKSTALAETAVKLLRNMKKLGEVREHCKQLSRYEHAGDEIYRKRLGDLFREEKDAVRLIQHKEFLEGLERSLDTCDHTGVALTAVVIKNG